MDLELLKKFYFVAEEGSISSAAKRLNTTQSALSRSMAYFEYRLKTQLLIRTRRGIELTSQGERLHEYAKKLMQENELFVKSFLEDENKMAGDLRIVAFPYLGAEWLVPAIKDFLELYPDINIHIHINSEDVNPVDFDIGIGGFIPNQPHLIQKVLFPDYNQFFASEEYLEKFGTPQKAEDLDHHRIITYKPQQFLSPHRSINLLFNIGRKPSDSPRKPYFTVDSLSGMLNAVLQGYGIAELPVFAALHNPKLKVVLPELRGTNLPVYYVFQENRKKSKKIQALYDYLLKKHIVKMNEK